MWICKDCSNKTQFSKIIRGVAYYTERAFFDEHGEEHDWDDYNTYDSDREDEDDFECCSCGSSNVEDVDDDEWENWNGPEASKPTSWKDKYEGD
jgi:hypothetical protein